MPDVSEGQVDAPAQASAATADDTSGKLPAFPREDYAIAERRKTYEIDGSEPRRALALSGGVIIQPDDLYLKPTAEASQEQPQPGDKWPLLDYLDRVETEAIMEALEKTRFNKTAAAKLLGITFRALRYRLERLGID